MRSLKAVLVAGPALLLAACSATMQTTSGAEYLARYSQYPDVATVGESGTGDTDTEVRRIAAIEPELQFPARIGLARIGAAGELATISGNELAIWADLAESVGPEVGELVPVSPLIAAMVSDAPGYSRNRTAAVIDHIRKGAARQHLDYVLVYETGLTRSDKANGLALADLTIVGMFVLPSRDIEVSASASGLLLDVRNGYPYATLTAYAEKKGLTRLINTSSTKQALSLDAEEEAVLALSNDVRTALEHLIAASKEKAGGQ